MTNQPQRQEGGVMSVVVVVRRNPILRIVLVESLHFDPNGKTDIVLGNISRATRSMDPPSARRDQRATFVDDRVPRYMRAINAPLHSSLIQAKLFGELAHV